MKLPQKNNDIFFKLSGKLLYRNVQNVCPLIGSERRPGVHGISAKNVFLLFSEHYFLKLYSKIAKF